MILAVGSFAESIRALEASPARAFFATPGRAWELLVGALAAFTPQPRANVRAYREIAAVAGLALIAFGYVVYTDATPFPGPAALVFCAGAALLLHAGSDGHPTTVARLLSAPSLALVGLISYSVYLWHWPLIVFSRYCFPQLFPADIGASLPMRLTLLGISLGIGYASWRFIEMPFRRRDSGASGRRFAFGAFTGLTAALVAISIAVTKSNGFPSRWPGAVLQIVNERKSRVGDFCKPLPEADHWPNGVCRIGSAENKADILIWGDSHARMLIEAFAAASARSNLTLFVATMAGCPPLAGVTLYGRSKFSLCSEFTELVLAGLARRGFRRVVLAGRWAYYAEGRNIESEGGQAVELSPGEIEMNPSVFAMRFEATVRRLQAQGLEVVIIGPVPEHRFNVASVFARNLVWRQSLPPAMTREAFTERQRHVLPLMQRLGAMPGVRILYPDRLLCGPDACNYKDGLPLYSDANHLSSHGLKLLTPLIDDIFAGAPPR